MGKRYRVLDLMLLLSFYAATGLGIRSVFTGSSRTVASVPVVRAGSPGARRLDGLEGSVVQWCATHRRHHAYADQYGDPHSPHLAQAAGIKGVLLGLWHGHMGWLFDGQGESEPEGVGTRSVADRDIVRIGGAFRSRRSRASRASAARRSPITQSFGAALTAFIWGSLVRIFLLHHVTWSINSICHFYGTRLQGAR